jgi:hypothetical protein
MPQPLRRCFLVAFPMGAVLILAVASMRAMGQALPQRNTTADVALTYAAARAAHTNGTNFWLQGGAIDLHALVYRNLGIVASVTGAHADSASALAAPLDMVTVVFGPRYTLGGSERLSIFLEALGGEAHGFHSNFAAGSGSASNPENGTTRSANALAFQAGGGVDLKLARHISARLVQVDYLRTQLPNGGNNLQNNLRLVAGLALRFGR